MSHEFKGHHVMLDIKGVDKRRLAPVQVKNVIMEACHLSKLNVLDFKEHVFTPEGYSIIILLAESHISAHTWPEHRGVMIDIFTCGETVPERAIAYLRKWFNGKHCHETIVERGVLEGGVEGNILVVS